MANEEGMHLTIVASAAHVRDKDAGLALDDQRVAEKELYLRSLLGSLYDQIGDHEVVRAEMALDDDLTGKLDATVSELERRHVDLLADIYDIQHRLSPSSHSRGEILRRYFMLTRGIADATTRIIRIEAEASAQQGGYLHVSGESIEYLSEKVARFECALEQMVDEHGLEPPEGAAETDGNARSLAALGDELDEVGMLLWEKAKALQTWRAGKRARVVGSVVRRIIEDPRIGADLVGAARLQD